jgi:predicted MFS family arabinose efflux permease
MSTARPAGFRDVFAVAEWRALFGTFVLSTVGDELARVALTVLVYARTGSPLLSALTFAISYLPWVVGGPVLSALADRLPRHRVLIATDVGRAVVVGVMVLPGIPLPVLLALLFVVSLGAPPFESARSALQADVLDEDRYAVASSITNVCLQLTSVIGFVLGGALVALIGARAALAFDAVTFLVSAGWLAVGLQRRPPPAGDEDGPTSLWQDTVAGLRHIAGNPRARAIMVVFWVGSLFKDAPEGLAAPFAAELGGTTADVGVLLAAVPLGVTVGGILVVRLVAPERRERLVAPLLLASLVLLAAAGVLAHTLPAGRVTFGVVVALLFVSGLASCWFIPLQALFVTAVPAALRGRAFGVAVSGLWAVQGLGVLGAGAVAERLAPSGVVAAAGVIGMVAVVPAVVALGRSRPAVAAGRPAGGASVA